MNVRRTFRILVTAATCVVVVAGTHSAYAANTKTPTEPTWTSYATPVALCNCADAEVVAFDDGSIRLYYSLTTNTHPIMSKISRDGGKTWVDELGERLVKAVFADVVRVNTTTYRMYYQSQEVPGQVSIRSATSTDGLTWTNDAGNRLVPGGEALTVTNIGGHSTVKLNDGTYMMSYIGSDHTKMGAGASIYWATSPDGLNFTKRGMVLDGTPLAQYNVGYDGTELVLWDDGTVKLYFRGEKGIEQVLFNGTTFGTTPKVIIESTKVIVGTSQYPVIPGDPTLVRYGNRWHLFHGSGPQMNPSVPAEGIYEAGYLAPPKTTITCAKGSKVKSVKAESPACPRGYVLATTIVCKKGATKKKVTAAAPKCPKSYRKIS